MTLEYKKEKYKCIRMVSILSRFVFYKKYLGILDEQLNKKDMNTQTDLISEIENAWEKLSQEIIDN